MERNERKNGLGFEPSNVGTQADASNVADTAIRLWITGRERLPLATSRHAVALHVISGRLHRLDERA